MLSLRELERATRMGAIDTQRIAAARAEALYGLGRMADGDAALFDFRDSDHGQVILARAARRVALKDVDGAARLLGEALEAAPDERLLFRRLGDLYADIGRAEQAEELWKRALAAPGRPLPRSMERPDSQESN